MLKKLFIQNFALIDCLELELDSGLNVLTGETGAGKSIIIDAVSMIIGGQGLTEFIRSGEEKAIVEGFFEIEENQNAINILQEYGFIPEKGDFLILTRELIKSGKNICRINGRQVNLTIFKEVAVKLVDIYGQYHQQSLLDPRNHIDLLDEFGGEEIFTIKSQLSGIFADYVALLDKIKKMEANEREQARMTDIYKYQLEEINDAGLQPDEDMNLDSEKNILANADKLAFLSNSAYEILYDGGTQKPVTDLISEAVQHLKTADMIDETVKSFTDALESILYQVEDLAREVRSYSDGINTDSSRLEEIENRLNLIKQLKKKYGDSITDIFKFQDQVASALELINNFDEELARLKAEFSKVSSSYNQISQKLTAIRNKAASGLIKQITEELKDLSMPYITFDISISLSSTPSPQGNDNVEFMISPNQGEPLKPLAKIVSGGEVSRIMLAFKRILAIVDSISTLIFDEVDAGIGGAAINSVAGKLSSIGRDKQVICVTHSPQIAGCAASHYQITKTVLNNRSVTKVKKLSYEERIPEISRMLAGDKITPVAIKHAQELLKHCLQ